MKAAPNGMLSEQHIERYSRQIILPQLGGRGQRALLSAAVAVVGGGNLSTATALYLAAAGVGRLALSEPSPLREVEAVNPDCRVSPLPSPFTRSAAGDVARTCSVVITSGAAHAICDVVNAACIAQRTPLVWADTAGSFGLMAVFTAEDSESPCYTCVYTQLSQWLASNDPADPFAETSAAFIGTLQATEAIKRLIGLDPLPTTRVLTYDAVAGAIRDLAVTRNLHCPTCARVRS